MPDPVYSPSYNSSEPESPPASWNWNHFEVRTLVCLIIKNEHKTKDPMDLTDKLNRALNPGSSSTRPSYSRDIPHADVQAMLKRILLKKSHAVVISNRDYTAPVTRAKVNAFMRNLDFDGGKEEWKEGRKEKVAVQTQRRLVRYMVRKEGGRPSPRSRDERDRRRMLLCDSAVKRLLRGWGIGASFWEDAPKGEDSPTTGNKDKDSPATVNPARHPYALGKAPSMPAGGPAKNVPNTPNSVAMWAGGFASSAATPLVGVMASQSLISGPGAPQQATMLDYRSYGGFGGLPYPQQQQQQPPYQWAGVEQSGLWAAGGTQPGDRRHPSSGQHVGRGF